MIVLKNVYKNYKVKSGFFKRKTKIIEVLKNINITIKDKECVGLIGLNGAGKSTLLKLILGILEPDSGDVKLFGKNSVKYRQRNMQNIGVVFGQRSQLRWDVSPLDSYFLNKAIYNIEDQKFDEILNKYADILDVREFWNRPVRTLSLGQKMRADLMASLLHSPKLLILDEPTVGVDIISKRKIIDLISNLKKEMTIIFTSHNLNDVYELCDRFILLNKGNIRLDNTKEEISQKINYITINIMLENDNLNYSVEKMNNFRIKEVSKYEYRINGIKIEELTEIINDLFLNNKVIHFDIESSDLETLVINVGKEEI